MTSGLVVDTLVTSPTAPTDNPIFITFNVERLETVVVIPRSSTVGDMIVRQHLIGCPSIAQFVFEGRHFAFFDNWRSRSYFNTTRHAGRTFFEVNVNRRASGALATDACNVNFPDEDRKIVCAGT